MNDLKKEVGLRIRELLTSRHMTVTELAQRLEISRANLYFILEGRQRLRMELGVKISHLFSVTTDELYGLKPMRGEIKFQVQLRVPQGMKSEDIEQSIREWVGQLEKNLEEERH